MPGVNYGRAVMKMRPDWQPGQTARPLDVVYYQNCLWACLRETNALPSLASADWMLSVRSVESDVTGAAEDQVLTIVKVGQELKAQYKTLPTYGIADITGLTTALAGKSPTGHTHAASDITGAALAARKINTTAPLSGGGDLSADRTFKINIGKGLKVNSNLLVLSVKEGSGLVMDSTTGELYFDPSQMPTDQFEAMLKALRLPIWLSRTTTWYVNGTTGSDQNDGSAPDKAFKTIQAALNYVSENYNFGVYAATVQVAAGTYNEDLTMPKYNASTGALRLSGEGKAATIITGNVAANTAIGTVYLEGLAVQFAGRTAAGSSTYQALRNVAGSQFRLTNVLVDLTTEVSAFTRVGLSGAGVFTVNADCEFKGDCYSFWSVAGGDIQLYDSTVMNGTVTGASVTFTSGAKFSVLASASPIITGNVTGRRHTINGYSVVNTNGGGAEYFPGTIAGVVSNGQLT